MRFAVPEFLWLLWAIPLVWFVLYLARGWGRRRTERFAGELVAELTSSVSPTLRFWRSALRLLALVLLVVALARPQWGANEVDVEQSGLDLVIALDISRSMLADDIQPSRLTRAKAEVAELIDGLEGDRVGLVFFAGAAFPQCPLTVDYAAARLFLSQADPTMIGAQGTDIADAVDTALELFGEQEGNHRVILLVTDGEDFSGRLDELRDRLDAAAVTLYAVGMGTAEGAPIPQVDDAGVRQGFFRDEDGSVVISRLDEAPLVDLARTTGGLYVRAGSSGIDARRIRAELKTLEGRVFSARRITSYQDRFLAPLGLALVLLLVEGFLMDRRRTA